MTTGANSAVRKNGLKRVKREWRSSAVPSEAPIDYFELPFLRAADLWLRPRTETLPIDPHWWRYWDDPRDFAKALGLVIASLSAGPVIDKRGNKSALLVGLLLVALSAFATPSMSSFGALIFVYFVLGLGGALLNELLPYSGQANCRGVEIAAPAVVVLAWVRR